MAFNYGDDGDIELDENGLPIEYNDDDEDVDDYDFDEDDFDDEDFDDEEYGDEEEEDEDTNEEDDDEDMDDDDLDDNDLDTNKKPDTAGQGEGGQYTNTPTAGQGATATPTSGAGAGATSSAGATGAGAGAGAGTAGAAGATSAGAGAAGAGAAGAGAAGAGAAGAGAAGAGLAAAWPVVLVILAIILIIVIVLLVCAAFIVATENADEEHGTFTFGSIASEQFYGVRTAYVDETELIGALQQSYQQYCIDTFNILAENSAVTLSFELPENGEYNTSTQQILNDLSIGMGNIIATGSDQYASIEFSSLYTSIQYFGIGADKIGAVNDFIKSYIAANSLASTTSSTIDALLDTAFEDTRLDYIHNQCEKIMIKDIAVGNSGFGTIQANLKGLVYLPKTDVEMAMLMYNIRVQNAGETVNMKVIYSNGTSESVLREETADISWTESAISSEFDESVKVNIGQLDEAEPTLHTEGISLFELLKTYTNVAKSGEIYTWKPTSPSLYLVFESNSAFTLNEFYVEVA